MPKAEFLHNGMPFSVDLVCDSINRAGERLSTFVLKYPRFIHAQMMTHRCLSRNAQSSRAMPTKRLLGAEAVIPQEFGENKSGMKPGERLSETDNKAARQVVEDLYKATQEAVSKLAGLGVHKQWVNRYLEPFTTITAIYTGTGDAWASVFDLRCHPDAQEEIQVLMNAAHHLWADVMPSPRDEHIPFWYGEEDAPERHRISIARCARVSYLNFEGDSDPDKDEALYARLLTSSPPHLSPFEHVAFATPNVRYANFQGWRSYRNGLGH